MAAPLQAFRALLGALRPRTSTTRMQEAARLVAAGAILVERESDDEVVLTLWEAGWSHSPTAVLYPEEGEWACDCGGADPCVHVVAGAMALEAAARTGKPLPTARATQGRVRYTLHDSPGGLRVARSVVTPAGETAVQGALGEVAVPVALGDGDRRADALLGPGGVVAPGGVGALFEALHEADVVVGGEAVKVSVTPRAPRAWVERAGAGYTLRIEGPPGAAVFAPGVLRRGDTLHPMGAVELTGPRHEKLPIVRKFGPDDVVEMVTRALPALEATVPVERRGKVPVLVEAGPRVLVEVSVLPGKLTARPVMVYGDPPVARVEGDRLVLVGGRGVPRRDRAAEVDEGHRLRDQLGLVLGHRTDFVGADGPRFVQRLRAFDDKAVGGSKPGAWFGEAALVPRLEVRETGFDLEFELPAAEGEAPRPGARADAATVLQAWREGLDAAPLLDGTWAPLPVSWLRTHGARVADLLAARDDHGELARAALPALAKWCEAMEEPAPPSLARLAGLLDGAEGIAPAELPADLTATLRPYQRHGVDWLCLLRDAGMGALLADDMGLGKTVQTLAALRGRCLVVAPRSVVHNWCDELRRFRPGLRVAVYHGPGRVIDRSADVTVTTYAVLRLDAEVLAAETWDAVVLDEAQAIKNPDSQAARAAYALRSGFRVALSGTPVENRLEELWSLMHFTNPGLLGGRGEFVSRYGDAAAGGAGAGLDALRARVGPFLLRRKKREVAPELPPRTEMVLRCALDEGERAVYDTVRAASHREVVEALRGGGDAMKALELLLRLRQAACHSGLVPGQEAGRSSKVEALVEALETAAAEGHRALVFSQWTGLLDRVEPHLREAGIGFVRLDGSTRDRAGVVAAFQAEEGPPVMLVSLKAGGTGLNLTAADHVFLLDPWWNPAVEDQAADRAHRIGQHRAVTIYRLVAEDTVEEGIVALQARKRALAEAALSGGDPAASLTRDDLLELLA